MCCGRLDFRENKGGVVRKLKLSKDGDEIQHLTRREFIKLASSVAAIPVFGSIAGKVSASDFTITMPKGLKNFEIIVLDYRELQENLKYGRVILPVSRSAEPIKIKLEPNYFGNKEWIIEYKMKDKTKREVLNKTWQYKGEHKKGKCRLNVHNTISGYVDINGFKKYFGTIGKHDDKLILVSYWQWDVERVNLPL